MPPPGFLSTYHKYKRDTDVVASWLAVTAKQHGYTAPIFVPPPASVPVNKSNAPPARRLKGKARKEAKQQQNQQHDVNPSNINKNDAPDLSPKPKHVLAIRDFVPLAEFIADKLTTSPSEMDHGAGIPLFFSTALGRAISVRKAFSTSLGDIKGHLNLQANATHAHFVNVLEKVLHVLPNVEGSSGGAFNMASMKNAANAVRDDSSKTTKSQDFNFFDVLQVFEPSDDFLNAPDAVPLASSSSIDLEYTVKYDDSGVECVFAFAALLKDLINLREEVGNLWNEYRSGKIDLAAAAVGANLATELARSMEEEMAPLLKKYDGVSVMLPQFFTAACNSLGLDPSQKERVTDDMNFACYDMGVTFMCNVASLLTAIRAAVPHNPQAMSSYNGKFGWYDAKIAHQENTNNCQLWAQEKAALLEVVSDITLLFELKGIPVHDEFARGIKTMLETQELPVWLCFAAQNYLDTLRLFGPGVIKPLAEFHRFHETTTELLGCVNMAEYTSDLKKDVKNLREMATVKMEGKDIFSIVGAALSHDSRSERAKRPSSFLLHNPLFCGLWIHYARVLFHEIGVKCAAKPGAVLCAVQLYAAVRQQQQNSSAEVLEWPEIDRLLAIQGPGAFFVGAEPPESPKAHFKNYCMSRGISPANWLADTKRRKAKGNRVPVQTSRAGIRELKFGAPASQWCAARAGAREEATSTSRVWNAEVVQNILEWSGWFEIKEEEQAKKDEAAEAKSQAGAAVDGKTKTRAKSAPARPALTAPQLVHDIAHVIHAEASDLVFNYFAIHEMSRGLLEQVRANADDIGLPHIPHIMTDVDIAGFVFAIAAEELAPSSGQSQRVLDKVAKGMRHYVAADSDGFALG
ncbi:hypothetical protein G7Z17_g2208 [Cylindrodendrum hubeiense]|uniref:DUF6604 domain-containing protein n=1 Tax=Cylindrodendrum hubeiense TaxID=595255 RepID=A0A9P5HD72_9HYPO|nr:hypothetical protein G7Z17_g2208 [Cylindrodendrum hubeiense]